MRSSIFHVMFDVRKFTITSEDIPRQFPIEISYQRASKRGVLSRGDFIDLGGGEERSG